MTKESWEGRLRRYVVAITLVGVLGAAALLLVGARSPVEVSVLGALGAAMVFSMWVPLRFQHPGGATGFTLDEAVLVAMLFTLPSGIPPTVHVLAVLVSHLIRRTEPLKIAFNTGAMALSSVAATTVFHAFGPHQEVLTVRSIVAAIAATAAFSVVNMFAVAELLRRLEGQPYGRYFSQVRRLNTVTWIGNSSFGLLLAYVAAQDPVATLFAAAVLIALHLGYRGYAGVLEEQERNERLHDVTQTLASAIGSPDALGRFLEQLARLFSGERAEIVVIVRDSARHLTVNAAAELEDRTGQDLPRVLDEALHAGRAVLRSEVDADANLRDALAAPLVFEGKTIGAVAVCDRHGLEPWDANDVKLLSSLANEVAVAVKNVELVTDLSEQTRKLGNIVSAASDGIALVDEHGRIVTWNPAFERMAGRPSREVVGRPWTEAFPVEDERSREQLHRVMQAVLAGRPVDLPVDLQVARADDDHRWLRCTFAPVDPADAGADETGAVLIARDVTHERENEELKNDFLATVSHELRTPLTPLKGFLATAESHWDDLDREQLREMVRAMRRQVDRLDALIADLLTVSDLDRRTIAFDGTEIDLSETVQDAIELLSVAAAARVAFTAVPEVRAIGDPGAIQRVIRALTDNALKHTTGMVTVTVGHRGDEATVAVSDEGPGIREWDRDRIFERFGRLGDHLTRSQGPGLGLAIARSLAERLGGGLELESEVGRGSTFVLVLPRPANIETPAV